MNFQRQQMEREISGLICFAINPHTPVKKLAKKLEGLDLSGALRVAGRVRQLCGNRAVSELTTFIGDDKNRGVKIH